MNMKLFLMAVVLTLAGSTVNAGITKVSVLPENSTANDLITFNISGIEGAGGVTVSDTVYSMNENEITIDLSLDVGFFLMLTPWSHSYEIGTLPAGTYDLTVNSIVAAYPNTNDTFNTSFEVVPEPATVLLASLGVFGIRRIKSY